jgi:hypothetical protein
LNGKFSQPLEGKHDEHGQQWERYRSTIKEMATELDEKWLLMKQVEQRIG